MHATLLIAAVHYHINWPEKSYLRASMSEKQYSHASSEIDIFQLSEIVGGKDDVVCSFFQDHVDDEVEGVGTVLKMWVYNIMTKMIGQFL